MSGKKVLWIGNKKNNIRVFQTNISTYDFINVQAFWGHKKCKLNNTISFNTIGLNQDYVILNPIHLLEFSKRCLAFCSKLILNRANLLFMDINIDQDTESKHKKTVLFFSIRSFQCVFSGVYQKGFLTRNFFKSLKKLIRKFNYKFDSIFLNDLKNNFDFFLETLNKLIPVITVRDSDYIFDNTSYFFLGNQDSKKSMYFFYKAMSDVLLKSLLYVYCLHILKNFSKIC